MTDDPEPISKRRPEIDASLSEICSRALSKKPVDRYQTMADFADDLDDWLEAVEHPSPKRGTRAKRVAIGLAAIVAAIASGVLVSQHWNSKTEEPTTQAMITAQDAEAATVRAELAWRLNNEDDLDRAIEQSTVALRLDDRCVSALLCRGNALIKKKSPKLASEDLLRAIDIDPASHLAMIDLAWAYNDLGEHEKALATATQAITLKSDSAEAHNQRGWARFKQGMFRDAIADFTNAITYHPQYVWAYRNRALAYKQAGEADLATNDEAQADEINKAARGR
jgi:tetratricopeptide (TPR) repeat protein